MKGPFVPLSVSYRETEKMLAVEPLAELLFVRGLAFAKEKYLDGYLAPLQVLRLTGDLEAAYHVNVGDLVDQLVRQGLWLEAGEEGGYLIDGWFDWNQADASRAGTLGNHVRWHVARERPDPSCQHCQAAQNAGNVGGDDRPESGAISQDRAEQSKKHPSSPSATELAGEFAEWWEHYPRKIAKQEAVKAYAKARKSFSAQAISEGLTRHLDAWRTEHRPLDKIPHAATWLNGQRFNDEVLSNHHPADEVESYA